MSADPSDPPFWCDVPGCGAYASRGEGWSGRRSTRGRWWCWPHYLEIEEQRSKAGQESVQAAPARSPKQLKLGEM